MKYTVDTTLKTIELHEPLTITEIVGLLTDIKNGMDYKVLGYNPVSPVPYTPYQPIHNPVNYGLNNGTGAPNPYQHFPTMSEIIGDVMLEHKDSDIKSFSFPGGFGFAISSKEEEQ